MYVSTTYGIGDTVYFTDDGVSVIRAEVREIRITQYEHSMSTRYLLTYGDDGQRSPEEDKLHRSPDAAFRAYDRAHPQQTAELAAA
jgi:hypothetical protein